jgi:hypothetical protein
MKRVNEQELVYSWIVSENLIVKLKIEGYPKSVLNLAKNFRSHLGQSAG